MLIPECPLEPGSVLIVLLYKGELDVPSERLGTLRFSREQ